MHWNKNWEGKNQLIKLTGNENFNKILMKTIIERSIMKTLLTAIIGSFLLATVAVAQTTAPATPVTCAALIKQFDDKTKTIKASDEAKKLRAQAEADNKAKKEADCNKNIQAAIKTLKK